MKRLALLLCGLFAAVSTAHAAKCGWLATSKLNETFPEYAPWQVIVGGAVGNCEFNSNPHEAPNIFGAIQSVKASPAEAADLARTLRDATPSENKIEPTPALGKYAFVYQPKDSNGKIDERSMFFVAHRGKVEVNGSLVLQRPIGPAERAAAEKLIAAALAVADDTTKLQAANKCPYFDATLIRQLLPDKDYEENVYGENSCMAQANSKAVILQIIADARAEQIATNMSAMNDGCKSENLPGLGNGGKLSYQCTSGNPRATVRFTTPGKMFEFSFAPEREPTPAERAILVQLARKASGW